MLLATLALALVPGVVTLDPAAVRVGQTGICVTEWTGGQRREVSVEVLGTLDAAAPDRTLVLVRLSDPELEGAGVVAGMSGSPVYIDGKLLGAVAFGWAFAREPLAGVTPFVQMRAIVAGGPTAPPPPAALPRLAAVLAGKLDPLAVAPRLPTSSQPRTVPLALAGLPGDDAFGRELLGGPVQVAAPATGSAPRSGVPGPGDMMAALLVWGDATLAAGGTVTAVEGDRVWAFGHPLFSLGAVRLPAARATVLAVQGSYQAPFKLFGVGALFGTLLADRPAGVLIQVGEPPRGVPVGVRVDDSIGSKAWSFHVAESPLLTPVLVTYLTNACLVARGAATGESSVRLRITASFADGREVALAQATRGPDALARIAAFSGALTAALVASPLPHPGLTGVDIALEREERPRGATIVEAVPERATVYPGTRLPVTVVLQPYLGDRETRQLAVEIPADAAPGPLDLIVADGAAWSDYRFKAQPVPINSFDDLLTQAGMLESSTSLVLALEAREPGVALASGSLPAVPPSWSTTLASGLGRGAVVKLATTIRSTTRWQAAYPLDGAYRVTLTVRPLVEHE
jgi:hypothetical protein